MRGSARIGVGSGWRTLAATSIEIALVPATLARTKLGAARAGERLNVEVDMIARYLEVLTRERR